MKHPFAARIGIVAVVTVILSALLFSLLYRYDNKYSVVGPQPQNGILLLGEDTLKRDPVLFLVNDWELYPGLLTPEELRADPFRSGKTVFIGQYTGFDPVMTDASRRGSATLLLNIAVPAVSSAYALELPEIYSAYRLYVNGELLCRMGDPSSGGYRPRTGNRAVMFTASDNIEIVIAMSNASHIYSGLVYPPAFGEPEAVGRLLATRLVIRAALAAVALGLGVFYLALGARLLYRKEANGKAALLYGLLCFCFLCYAGYPVIKTVLPGGLWWYVLESFCYCSMLLLTMLLLGRQCGYRGKRAKAGLVFGAAVCVLALCLPLIARSGPVVTRLWSLLVNLYFVVCALFLTFAALYGMLRGGVRSNVMLCGALVFDIALVMDRLYPDFEPILSGWFSEWAGAALVCCTGVLIAQDILFQYRQRRALEENVDSMHRLMETQQAYYPLVLEQAEEARAARHDLRHHLAAVRSLARAGELDGLTAYLDAYDPGGEPVATVFCSHPVLNMLLSGFTYRAKAAGACLIAHADVPDCLELADPDLFAICANLLENALEAVVLLPEEQRRIEVGIRLVPGSLAITVDNTFDGVAEERAGSLLSRKRPGQAGVGTASVRRIVERYGGFAAFTTEQNETGSVFHAEIILPNGRENSACLK